MFLFLVRLVAGFLPIFFFCWRPADSVMVSFFFSTNIKQYQATKHATVQRKSMQNSNIKLTWICYSRFLLCFSTSAFSLLYFSVRYTKTQVIPEDRINIGLFASLKYKSWDTIIKTNKRSVPPQTKKKNKKTVHPGAHWCSDPGLGRGPPEP